MKSNELMLGDIILKDGQPGRVIELYGGEVADCYAPVFITPEILEANGITLLEVGDNGPATPKKHLNRYEKWFIHTTWKDTFLWYDRMADHWHLQDMSGARFHHVHELQHALRLAGLADLADNFKIMKGGQ